MYDNNKYKGIVLLDTETANYYPDSICQIAAYVIKDDQVIDKFDYYVRPEPDWFVDKFVDIHGITSERVRDEPTIEELYPFIEKYFNGDYLIVAHNAYFDVETVFKGNYQKKGIPFGDFDFACTVNMLRKYTNWKYPHYSLEYLTELNDIKFHHHDAYEDVRATLEVVRKMAGSLENLLIKTTKKGYKIKNFKDIKNKTSK